jgi:hypothetical protein
LAEYRADAKALEKIGDVRATDPLMTTIKDDGKSVVDAVAKTLALIRHGQ